MGLKNKDRIVWTDKPHNFLGLPINFTRYILTKDKLLIRHGLLTIKQEEILLYRILDKKVQWPLGQRIFRCGTVMLAAKDVYQSEITLKAIKNVDSVVDMLDELIAESRAKNNATGREMFGALNGLAGGIDEIDDCDVCDPDDLDT